MGAVDLSGYIWTEADRGIQPPSPVPLDTNNPLVRGLVSVINPAWRDAKLYSTGLGVQYYKPGPEGVKFVPSSAGLLIKDISPISGSATLLHFGPLGVLGGSGKGASGIGNNTTTSAAYFYIASAASSALGIRAYIRPDLSTSTVYLTTYSKAGYVDNLTDDVWVAVYNETPDFRIYRNGVNDTASVAVTGTPSPIAGMGNHSIGGYRRGTNYYGYTGSACYLGLAWNRALSDAEIKSISDNPWQIFADASLPFYVEAATGGTTAVSADAALTYYVRALLSSDSGVQYAIRNAIYRDDEVGYVLRSAIAQNNQVGYVLRAALAKDDAEAYKIRGLIQSDDVEAYNVRGLVQTSGNETYSIRGLVQTDATTNYDIQGSTSVASTSTASYSVRGSVSGDVSPSYAVRGVAQSDVSAGYSVRASAYRDVAASYAIEAAASSVYADLTASYSIDGVAPSVDYDQIAAAVLAALQATTIPVNNTLINGAPVIGDGSEANPWRGVGVSP